MLEKAFLMLWTNSWQAALLASVLAVLLMVLAAIGRRPTAGHVYWLWLLVIMRLLWPVSPSCSVSLYNVVPRSIEFPSNSAREFEAPQPPRSRSIKHSRDHSPDQAPTALVASHDETIEERSGRSTPLPSSSGESPERQTRVEEGAAEIKSAEDRQELPAEVMPPRPFPRMITDCAIEKQPSEFPERKQPSGTALGAWGWLVGFVLFLGWYLRAEYLLLRNTRFWKVLEESPVKDVFEACKRELGMKTNVRLVLAPNELGPATTGLLRPTVVIPESALASLPFDSWRWIFLHELVHLRRRDAWLHRLSVWTCGLHWFNPIGWLVLARLRHAREAACDAEVLERLNRNEAIAYGHAILRMMERHSPSPLSTGLIGVMEEPRYLIRRMKMIVDDRKPTRWTKIWGLSLIVLLAIVGMTGAVENEEATKGDASETSPSPLQKVEPANRIGVSGDTLFTKVYSISDLLLIPPPTDAQSDYRFLPTEEGKILFYPSSQGGEIDEKTLKEGVNSMIEYIRGNIAPESWETNGGKGRLLTYDSKQLMLVISQTEEIHDRIVELLKELRRKRHRKILLEATVREYSRDFFESNGIDFSQKTVTLTREEYQNLPHRRISDAMDHWGDPRSRLSPIMLHPGQTFNSSSFEEGEDFPVEVMFHAQIGKELKSVEMHTLIYSRRPAFAWEETRRPIDHQSTIPHAGAMIIDISDQLSATSEEVVACLVLQPLIRTDDK